MSVRTLARKPQGHDHLLGPDENPFSTNKVTGWSLNFPIIGTCTPSVVCSDTCYFAKGPATWPASLAKQHRLLNSLRGRSAPARGQDCGVGHAAPVDVCQVVWRRRPCGRDADVPRRRGDRPARRATVGRQPKARDRGDDHAEAERLPSPVRRPQFVGSAGAVPRASTASVAVVLVVPVRAWRGTAGGRRAGRVS